MARIITELSPSLDRRLQVYCLAAAAAGVTLLSLAEPVAAEVLYTPAEGRVPFHQWSKVDLNHDGIPDLSFFLSSSVYKVVDRDLAVRPVIGGGIIGYKGLFFTYASAFPAGAFIGSKGAFLDGDPFLCRTEINHYDGSFTFSAGAWRNARALYLGVKFLIDGDIHYGWVRLSVGAPEKLKAIVTGYAYETIANQPIAAGQTSGKARYVPSSPKTDEPISSAPAGSTSNAIRDRPEPVRLGMLALGTDGVALWRP